MALFLLLVSLSLATLVQTARIFGTVNGYDAGGTDPICFTSKTNVTDQFAGGLLSLQQGDYTEFELLPTCFEGTDLDVEPLDLGPDRLLNTGSNYTFRIALEVLLSQISDKIPQNSNSTIYLRFLLCEASILGFCNPLQDFRELDGNLVLSETDFVLGISDGPFVLSRWVESTLYQVETDSDLYKASVNITLQLPKGIREGAYSFIGHAVMNYKIGDGIIERVDIADAIPQNLLQVRNPPTIRYVTESMKIIVGVATGICGSFALFCFGFIIYYRANPVMQLAQAPFLAALAGCCLVSIGFTFTFLPTHDVFCHLRGPMTLIPLTTAAAIMVARTWRIYVTLTVALSLGRKGRKGKSVTGANLGQRLVMLLTFLSRLPFLLCQNPCKKKGTRRMRSSVPTLRQAVTAEETASLIVILSFPQAFLQIFNAVYYVRDLEIEHGTNSNNGRYVCTDSEDWNLLAGFCLAASVFLLAVVVSWISRNLPSAFNEKDQVFQAASISVILVCVVAALEALADEPTSSPNIQVFLRSSGSIGVAMSLLVVIVWPKIRRVRSGEKVVMSRLLNAARGASSSPSTPTAAAGEPESNFTVAGQNATAQIRNRITVNRDDPIPKEVETGILAMEELFRGVTNECGEGRSLSLENWHQLRTDVAHLHYQLDQLDFAWTDNEQRDNNAMTTTINSDMGNTSAEGETAV